MDNLITQMKERFQIGVEGQTLYKTVTFMVDHMNAIRQVAQNGAECAESAVAAIISSQNARKCMQCLHKLSNFQSVVMSHSVGKVTALMCIDEYDVHFQFDSMVDVNTICAKFMRKYRLLLPSKQKLTMWNDLTIIKPLGEAVLNVVNSKNGQSAAVFFTVVLVDNG